MQGASRNSTFRALVLACATVLLAALPAGALAATNVTTAGYNNLRDDWDAAEPALAPAAIQSASFGKLFSTKLEGAIYAQPLVYEGKVIVTTEKANAYALDPVERGGALETRLRQAVQSRRRSAAPT